MHTRNQILIAAIVALNAATATAACKSQSASTVVCSGSLNHGYLARVSQAKINTSNLSETNPNAPEGSNLRNKLTVNIAKGTIVSPNPRVQLWTINDQTGAISTPII